MDQPVTKVADYLSDFSTSAEWDPHTRSCVRLDDGPIRVGAKFRNVQKFLGRQSSLGYEVIEYEPGTRITLQGGSETIRTRDEIQFEDLGGGRTTVTYTVKYELQGVAALATPLAAVMMKKIADDAELSLHEHLEKL